MSSNQGFVDLHTPLGMLFIAVSALFLIGCIFGGGFLVKMNDFKAREYRAALKKQIEQGSTDVKP